MKLIIFGANGLLGQWTWKLAIEAGHEVTAFVRSPDKLHQDDPKYGELRVVTGDVMDADAVKTACEGQDLVISCVSPAGGNSTVEMAQSIITNAMAAGVQTFYMVAGCGLLWIAGTDKKVLVKDDGPEKRQEALNRISQGHLASVAFMETTGLTQYTYLCPGQMVEGGPTEDFVVSLDDFTEGGMKSTQGSVAKALVDDLNVGRFIGHRICIAQAVWPS